MKFSAYISVSVRNFALLATLWINGSLAHQRNDSYPSLLPATVLVKKAISALGGMEVLESITTLIYEANDIFRLRTTMENHDFFISDTVVAVSGSQNVTYSYVEDKFPVSQRIDRNWDISDEWLFASPAADPRSFSLVVRAGLEGYACYTEGNNYVLIPPNATQGYVDPALTHYLVLRATKMSPRLMLQVLSTNDSTSSFITLQDGVLRPAVTSPLLEITVIFDPETYLPSIIRTVEDNALFGISNRDLQVYHYTTINGVKFPTRFTTTYQNQVTEDFKVSNVLFNPSIPSTLFDGLPANQINGHPAAADPAGNYSSGELGEWSDNMLWISRYTGTFANILATHPAPSLENVWNLAFEDAPGYSQLVVKFEDAVFVFDSPPHQSLLVIEWVRQVLGKEVTHLWPSHHHHDHAYGTQDYVNTGAKLVVPEIGREFWSALPNVSIITYDEQKPFIYKDTTTQLRLIWHEHSSHCADQGYAIVTTSRPNPGDDIVVFEADTWNPGLAGDGLDEFEARTWLDQALKDGLSVNAIVAPSHGVVANLTDLIKILEFPYPDLKTTDWKFGGALC